MLFDVFADLFPKTFRDHVSRLEADTQYRTTFQTYASVLPLDVWENTPKWKMTARFRKLLNTKCERCGSGDRLHAHHKTYKHIGVEVLYPGDLEVLCESCHAGIHQLTLWPVAPGRPQPALRFPLQ